MMKMKPMNRYLALPLAIAALTIGSANAVEVLSSNTSLQGGSNASVTWMAPKTFASHAYKVYVWIPADSTATNAMYYVYPNDVGGGACSATDPKKPCFEFTIDTTKHLGQWVQLQLANDPTTNWTFVNGSYAVGRVTVNASNISSTQTLTTGSVLMDDLRIGQHYQGGIIVVMNSDGKHGLIAADQDLPGTFSFTAAQQAVKVSSNYDAAGQAYSDWRVPTRTELNTLWQHKDIINASGTFYWSSTATSGKNAWLEIFSYPAAPSLNGFTGSDGAQTFTASVRPVRSF